MENFSLANRLLTGHGPDTVRTDQVSRRAECFPAEEVGGAEAEDAVSEDELDAEIDDQSVQLPQLDRPAAVPRPYQVQLAELFHRQDLVHLYHVW